MKNFLNNLKLKRRAITWFARLGFLGNASKKMKVIGVTGTNGKTTTTTLLYQIARALGYKAGLIGTVENIINDQKFEATHTTPDPISLHKLLNEMLEKGCQYVFMETSSHALDQNRTAGVHFSGAIFTNLTHDHLNYHGNFENYFKAKRKLFDVLDKNAFALSNSDDQWGERMLEKTKARKFFYGFKKRADFFGNLEKSNFEGTEIEVNGDIIKSKLLGEFNSYNMLTVWSACELLGFCEGDSKMKVLDIFLKMTPPRGRFEYFYTPNKALVVVDYAHTPDALENVILTARGIKNDGAKLISVFGCGGDRDPMKRPVMGEIGASLSDIAIFTSDNPRSEDPEKIIEDMKKGLSPELLKKVMTISDRREAIKESVKIANSGDVILCAGKGHETYQEVYGVKNHFDDFEEFKNIF